MSKDLQDKIIRLAEALEVRSKWKTLQAIEKKLQKELAIVFEKQRDVYLSVLEKNRHRIDTTSDGELKESDAGDINQKAMEAVGDQTADEMRNTIDGAITLAFHEGGKKILAEYSPSSEFYINSPEYRERIRRQAARSITRIDETTRKRIKRTLEKGVAANKSYTAIAADIAVQFDDFATPASQGHLRDRAQLVAVTELGNAFEDGADQAAENVRSWGIELEKAWQTVEDDVVSDDCWENQAQGWIDYDEDFQSGDSGPLRFPGCRCTKLRRRKRN